MEQRSPWQPNVPEEQAQQRLLLKSVGNSAKTSLSTVNCTIAFSCSGFKSAGMNISQKLNLQLQVSQSDPGIIHCVVNVQHVCRNSCKVPNWGITMSPNPCSSIQKGVAVPDQSHLPYLTMKNSCTAPSITTHNSSTYLASRPNIIGHASTTTCEQK